MALSQNCIFQGALEATDPYLPAGRGCSMAYVGGCKEPGWEPSESDLWQSSGWELVLSRSDEKVSVVVTSAADAGQWLLQVAPLRVPGLLGRLMKKGPSASTQSVFAVADVEHEHLTATGLTAQRWCWDGYPDDEASSAVPMAAP